ELRRRVEGPVGPGRPDLVRPQRTVGPVDGDLEGGDPPIGLGGAHHALVFSARVGHVRMLDARMSPIMPRTPTSGTIVAGDMNVDSGAAPVSAPKKRSAAAGRRARALNR